MSFKQFGKLLSEGIASVAMRQEKTMAAVEQELANRVDYSRPMIQKWRQGDYLPRRPEVIRNIVEYCLSYGRVDRHWATSLLHHGEYSFYEELLTELFSEISANTNGYKRPDPAITSIKLESPEGTMHPDSPFYIERPGDIIAATAIRRQGVTITLKGPRQMGKSSLLMRVAQQAKSLGKHIAILDFQLLKESLSEPDIFYRQFCRLITDELGLEEGSEKIWAEPLSNNQRCTHYLSNYILTKLKRPLLLALDEVDIVFDTSFKDNFFGMLRSWHNNRARPTSSNVWSKLDLALVTSTEPYYFITDFTMSPFNVGEPIELEDFTQEHVSELNERQGTPLEKRELGELYKWINGHPYLTRLALYQITHPGRRWTWPQLLQHATTDDSPFTPHLRNQWRMVLEKSGFVDTLRKVMQQQSISEESFLRLHSTGLLRRQGDRIVFRNRLYQEYFEKRLKDGTS